MTEIEQDIELLKKWIEENINTGAWDWPIYGITDSLIRLVKFVEERIKNDNVNVEDLMKEIDINDLKKLNTKIKAAPCFHMNGRNEVFVMCSYKHFAEIIENG